MNARDKSYDESLDAALRDPVEAAAYVDAVIEIDDPAALLPALRRSPRLMAWPKWHAGSSWAKKRSSRLCPRAEPDHCHGAQGASRGRVAAQCHARLDQVLRLAVLATPGSAETMPEASTRLLGESDGTVSTSPH